MSNKELHNLFLERLDTLPIQCDIEYKEEKYKMGVPLGSIPYTVKKKYLHKYCDVTPNNFETWNKKNNVSVPNAFTLLSISQHFHTSVDYLLGNVEAQSSYSEEYIHQYCGLDYDAIRQLRAWKEEGNKKGLFHAQTMQSLNALNIILSDKYRLEQNSEYMTGWDALHYIGSYLISEKIAREKGSARFQSGDSYLELEKGDIVIKANTKKEMPVDMPIVTEKITNNIKKIGVYEENNPDNCYYIEIAELYKASALKNLGALLDRIIIRQKEQ